jgi:hypothetical protein
MSAERERSGRAERRATRRSMSAERERSGRVSDAPGVAEAERRRK